MLNGIAFRDALISAANHISNNRQQVDALNVFPVPDGDTGTNMSMTINAAARELELIKDPNISIYEVSKTAAGALLRGARGNSGVILSLLFRGFSKGLKGLEEASGVDLAHALSLGVEAAYKAVMKPTEGTILTVARVASEVANEKAAEISDPVAMWQIICDQAAVTLEQTPDLLPVLKKAGVIDSGGKGLVIIFEGMLSVFKDNTIIQRADAMADKEKKESVSVGASGEFDSEITFGYCTEYIVNRDPSCKKDPVSLRAYLDSIGDSVVVVDDESIIKVHVHTDHPGKAIEEGLAYGYLTNMKIDNMRMQHESKAAEAQREKAEASQEAFPYMAVDPTREVGFVAVCAGQGLAELFKELGVDAIVSGGQTMNPSTDDILAAIHSVGAKNVFVLPNNKNIIMAAEQAVKLADRKVTVIQTRTIPQGLAAMLNFDPDASTADNRVSMTKGFEHVQTGQITFAARDSEFDGVKIKKDDLLGLANGKLEFCERDFVKASTKLVRSLVKKDTSFITLIYGEGVTKEQMDAVETALRPKLPEDVELTVIDGGQPVYHLIVSVE